MEDGKMTLTKREKRLLFVGGCIGVIAVMVMLVLLPLTNRLADNNEEYERLLAEQVQIDIALATGEGIRAGHASAFDHYNQIRSIYSGESLSSDIGLILTELVTRHHLTPISQHLSFPAEFIVPVADDEEEDENTIFSYMSVTMTVSGEYSNLKRFLDSFQDMNYIRVKSVSFVREIDEYGHVELDRINIGFVVLMLLDDIFVQSNGDEEEN